MLEISSLVVIVAEDFLEASSHYWNRRLYRVFKIHGKHQKTAGKTFAESYTRQRTLGNK